MKIALSGYGKMGKEIEKIALKRGHTIVCKISVEEDWLVQDYKQADVVIDFSIPNAVVKNIKRCFEVSLPVVVGTTGWKPFEKELKDECLNTNQSVVAASNFSIGVNLFFGLIRQASELFKTHTQYKAKIEEIHHIHKLDAPSGTALSMDVIMEEMGMPQVPIESKREGEVVGVHELKLESEQDIVQIRHEAKTREGFALGAVVAAEWLCNRQGWYGMEDVLGLNFK